MPQGGMGFATDPEVNDRSAATWCNEIFFDKISHFIYVIDIIYIKSIWRRYFPPFPSNFPLAAGKFRAGWREIFIVRYLIDINVNNYCLGAFFALFSRFFRGKCAMVFSRPF
jgi:hypothetical protein